jgi:hypothetical protein
MDEKKDYKHSVIVWGRDGKRLKGKDRHYTAAEKPKAIEYVNGLLVDGYKARLRPYRKPMTSLDYIAQQGPPDWLKGE